MALVNVMEKLVQEKLEEMLKIENCCKCDRCVEDMTAKALNKLPAKYVSTHNGDHISNQQTTHRQNTDQINDTQAQPHQKNTNTPSHT